jgi:hypothetical protein
MRRSITIAAVALTLAACGSTEPIQPGSPAAMSGPDGQPVVVITNDRAAWPHDAFRFENVSIDGDLLTVEVTYGGGCVDHRFALVVGAEMMESDPVQMRGSLAHDANGDKCRALVGRAIVLDVSPLAQLWRDSYRQQSGSLILHLDGWPTPIHYEF